MNVLVTGGAGYIGSHTCKALHAAGMTPVVYDNLVYGHADAVRWGPFEQGELADRKRLAGVIRSYGCQAVIHFAAYAYVGESVTDPGKYYRNNVCGSLSLLETMVDTGVREIIFSSTCAVYGVPEIMPMTEQLPSRPVNPYGASKMMVERMLADFSTAHGIRSIALRYFNASGSDPDGELSERHDPETHLIPRVLMAAAGSIPHVDLFGDDYPTPDGTCVRDYIHVADLAAAHVLALTRLQAGGESLACNLGTGTGVSVREIVDAAAAVTGREIPVRMAPRRAGDPPVLVADASLATVALGWTPRWPDVADHIRHAWAVFPK